MSQAETGRIDHFDTPGDFLRWLEETPPAPGWQDSGWGRSRNSNRRERPEFYGSDSFATALKMAANPWPEGLALIQQRMGMHRSYGRSRVRQRDVAGDLPDVGAYLSGSPVSMTRRIVTEGTKRPVLDVIFNCTFQGNIRTNTIENFGGGVASAVDEIEGLGFSVNLQLASLTLNSDYDGKVYGVLIDMKQAGEPLELDRLIFYTAHPSFQRRLMFAVFELMVPADRFDSGYGSFAQLPDVPEGAIYIPSSRELNNLCGTPAEARNYVRSKIREQRPDLLADDLEEAA